MKILSLYALVFMMACSWCPLHGMMQTDFSQDDETPVILVTDGEVEFKISHYLMSLSETLKESKALYDDDEPISLPEASAEVLSHILESVVQGRLPQELSLGNLLKMLELADFLGMENIKEPLYKEIPFHITKTMPVSLQVAKERYGINWGKGGQFTEAVKMAGRKITWNESANGLTEFVASSISIDDKLEILKNIILEDWATMGLIIGDERLFTDEDYLVARPTLQLKEQLRQSRQVTKSLAERREEFQKRLNDLRSQWNLNHQVSDVLIPTLGEELTSELKKQLEKKYPTDPAEIEKKFLKSFGYDPWKKMFSTSADHRYGTGATGKLTCA